MEEGNQTSRILANDRFRGNVSVVVTFSSSPTPPHFVASLYSNTNQRSRSLVVTRIEVAVSSDSPPPFVSLRFAVS